MGSDDVVSKIRQAAKEAAGTDEPDTGSAGGMGQAAQAATAAAASPAAAPAEAAASPSPAKAKPKPVAAKKKQRTHTVKSGDTLSAIGQRYGVSWQKIAKVNKIKNPDLIYPGQTFVIPED